MHFKVALLCCLGLTAVHAKPLDGFKCVDVRLRTPAAPTATRSVRICAPAMADDEMELERSLLDIDVPARHLLPPYEDYIDKAYPHSGQFYWPIPQAQEYAPMSIPAPAAPQPYPYQVINNVLPQEKQPIDFQPLEQNMLDQQTKLKGIVEDVSTVKESVSDLENHLKTVSDTFVAQEKDKKADLDINIVMKLDPALEELLRNMLTLASDKTIDEIPIENNDKEFEGLMNYIRTGGRVTEESEPTDTERDSIADDSSNQEAEVFDVEANIKNENKSEDEYEEEVKKEEVLQEAEKIEETAKALDEQIDDYRFTDEELQSMLNEILGQGPILNRDSADVNDKEEEEEDYINSLFSSAADKTEAETGVDNAKDFDLREDSDEISEKNLDDILNSEFAGHQPLGDYADDTVTLLQLLTYFR